MGEDWFRSSRWDDAAREDFERRLIRARAHNRPQYLRIKALALQEAGHLAGAEELLLRVLSIPGDHAAFEAVFAHELLGDLAMKRGDRLAAERRYRRVLKLDSTLNGTTATVEIALAELLLDTGRQTDLREAAIYRTPGSRVMG